MSNRFEKDSARAASPFAPPPIGPDGVQYYLEQGRRERTRMIRAGPRSGGASLVWALKATLDVVRSSAYAIAKRAPNRLTSPCR